MELTRRQEEFTRTLLDLYREVQEPFHYTELAERLGVSPFTAYDMLRLLEEKGFVTSTYHLPEGKSGPGRSGVYYLPTDRARRMMQQLAGAIDNQDWETVKERVLEKMKSGELVDRELTEGILARVPPDEPEVIRYCTEVMTVIALRLRHGKQRKLLTRYLPEILSTTPTACRPNLSLLGGFVFGVLAEQEFDETEWSQQLLQHAWQYQALVVDMEPATCKRLISIIRGVLSPLFGSQY